MHKTLTNIGMNLTLDMYDLSALHYYIAIASQLTHIFDADDGIIGNEVSSCKGPTDTRVSGFSHLQEWCLVRAGEQDLWTTHLTVPTSTVLSQTYQNIQH